MARKNSSSASAKKAASSKKKTTRSSSAAGSRSSRSKSSSSGRSSRSSSSAGSKRRTGSSSSGRQAGNPLMGMEIVCWTILALSVLIFISLIGYGGSLGRSLSDLLFGLFGTNAYVFPFLLLFLTLYQLVNRGNRIALIRFFSIIALFLVFCGILMLVMLPQATLFSIKDYYDFGAAYHRGGGAVGGALILFFKPTVGVVGTYLVLFIAVFILAALITQKSIFMETGQKSTEALEEHRVRSAQVREERREEKRELEKARREMKRAKLEAQKAAYEAQMMERAAGDEGGGGIAASPIFYSVLRKEDPNEEGAGKQSENNKPLFTTDLFSGDSKKKKGKRKQLTPADVIFVDSLDADADGKDLSSAGASASAAAGAASAASSAGRMPEDGGLTGGLTGSAAAAVSASAGTKASLAGLSSDRNAGSVSPGRKKKKASQDFLLFPNDSGEGNEEDFEDEDDLFSIADASASRGERSAPGRSGSAGAAASLRGNNSSGRRNKLSSLVTDAADAGDDADFASGEALSPDLVINRGSVSSEPVEEEADTGDDLPGAVVSAEDIHNAAPSVRKSAGRDEASKEAESSGRKKGKESGEEASDERRKPLSAKKEAALESERQLDAVSKEIEEKESEEEDIPYEFPSLDFLARPSAGKNGMSDDDLKETATKLVKVLEMFGVRAKVMNISCGPSVTRYELMPELGTKVSKITGLADDIKLNMAAADVRIEAPIPGKAAVGIEIPNKETSMVCLRELIDSKEFRACQSKKLSYVVGKDIAGRIIVSDIAKMPHLMIAGATGSGKSVFINTLVMSILYNADPNEVKLIMIDPKVVELSVYNGIPHLYIPVVTDPKKAAGALNWGVAEMTRRYELFAGYGVRNLAGFNAKVDSFREQGIPDTPKRLPQIVIIVDELADLMMVSGNEVEDAICRLAQLARACGIHLVIATQRPSVDVITGLIKANIPSRIAFSVSSGTDSRTILDMVGAEKLLGNGDMLFAPQTFKKPLRVQGAFVSDEEIQAVVDAIRIEDDGPGGSELMKKRMAEVQKASSGALGGAGGGDVDELFADAGRFIIQKDKASIGMLQRWFKIGFNRAARIMDQLSDAGVVGADEGTKPRKVLMSEEQFENYLEQN